MTHDTDTPQPLDCRRPDTPPPGGSRAMSWQFIIAYVLMILPLVYGGQGHADPVPADTVATMCVLIGIAIGAGLYVVRRQPGNALGWIGLVVWGALSAVAMVGAFLK